MVTGALLYMCVVPDDHFLNQGIGSGSQNFDQGKIKKSIHGAFSISSNLTWATIFGEL